MIFIRSVVDAQHDDAAHVGPKFLRIAAAFCVGGKPVHVASARRPRESAAGAFLLLPLRHARPRNADHVKAVRARGIR